jgi:FixJ family two-component response regulator
VAGNELYSELGFFLFSFCEAKKGEVMNDESPIVLVVDDDPSVCSSLRRILRSAGLRVQTFSSTSQLFAHGRPTEPCCLVLDIRMPDGDGLSFQSALARAGMEVPIIFITGHGDVSLAVRAMKAGAVDFLSKPFDPAQLLRCIKTALTSDAQSRQHQVHLADVRLRYIDLTPRERQVFAAVTSGMLNKQVASDLGIAEKTIKVHRARVMEKMGAIALTDLVRMADLLLVQNNS